MTTFNDEALADARERLHDFMMGFAGLHAGDMEALVRADWALAARIEQLRRHPLVAVFDDELLAMVAARAISPNVEARYLAMRLREVETEERAEEVAGVGGPASAGSPQHAGADLPPTVMDMMERTIALIARDQLGFATLDSRGRDHLDFRECGVAGVRAALIEAYVEGWHAAA